MELGFFQVFRQVLELQPRDGGRKVKGWTGVVPQGSRT